MKTTLNNLAGVMALTLVTLMALLGFAPGSGTALNNSRATPSAPTSVTMDWQTLVPAGGLNAVDANPVTNFGAVPVWTNGVIDLTSALGGGSLATNKNNRRVVELKGMGGNSLGFRVKYDAATAAGTSLTFCVGGCGQGGDFWDRMVQVGTGARSITITTKATDMTDGTFKYTDWVPTVQSVDNKGMWAIVGGVEVTGFGASDVLQVKGV